MSIIRHSYFLFYSSYWTEDDPSREQRAKIKIDHPRFYNHMLVGVDENDDDYVESIPERCRNSSKQLGIHLYLEGPGGPTGSRVDDDEYKRIKAHAEAVAIDTGDRDWITQWNRDGWPIYFRKYSWPKAVEGGFYSIEIDNLYRHLNATHRDIGAFLRWFDEEFFEAGKPKLLLKNCGVKRLKTVKDLISEGSLRREALAEFAIMEDSALKSDETMEQVSEASGKLGIQTLESNNTWDYQAEGKYEVARADIVIAGEFELPTDTFG